MYFANIEYLFLLLLLIPYIVWYIRSQKRREPTIQVSSTRMYQTGPKGWKVKLIHLPFLLRLLTFTMLVFVLARPQTQDNWQKSNIEGIDIMLSMDISTSMLAQDLRPNRIEAAKRVAAEFINNRPTDNIGLTVFAGEAYTQCPLTVDHTELLNLLSVIGCNIVQAGLIHDGTAIGMGLSNAVSRLKDSKAKSKVIILLTDGINNQGEISPLTAAELAKRFGIRVYTIGAGTNNASAPYPLLGNVPVEIDEKTLIQIATTTGGQYFRATNTAQLNSIYKEIDQLERSKLQVKEFSKRDEQFALFGLIAFTCLFFEILLRNTVLKKLP